MYRRILLAYGGSDHLERALAAAVDLAATYGAHLIIVTVIGEDLHRSAEESIDAVNECLEEQQKHWERRHWAARSVARKGGVSAQSIILPGHVVEAIVSLADREKADLVVLGGLGHSRLLWSRTGVQIYFQIPCPVFIVH